MEQEEPLEKLRTYAKAASAPSGIDEDNDELELLATRLARSLSSLESQVKHHEDSLEKVAMNWSPISNVEADT